MEVCNRLSRTTRLLRLQMLLCQYPDGIEVGKIAEKINTSKRTVYRDLISLESDLGIPIWEKNSKRGVLRDCYLPPINFTLKEAANIFLMVRLLQNYYHYYNPSTISTFDKLNTIVPPPLKKQILNTIEYLEKQPRDETRINNFDKLVEAWLSQHRVKFRHLRLAGEKSREYVVEPYFIEPTLLDRSCCMMAYCDAEKSIMCFKLDNIDGDVTIESETYEIPRDFNAMNYVSSGWDLYVVEKIEKVKLHFSKRISKNMLQTRWHPSQEILKHGDGTVTLTFKVRNSIHFKAWILMWGSEVEVIEPKSLRDEIKMMALSTARVYTKKKKI